MNGYYAQQDVKDSLRLLIINDKQDSSKCLHLLALGAELVYDMPDSSVTLWVKAENLVKKNLSSRKTSKIDCDFYERRLADLACYRGFLFKIKGEGNEALIHYQKSISLCKKIGYKQGLADANNNLGVLYDQMGEFEKALKCYEICRQNTDTTVNAYETAMNYSSSGKVLYAIGRNEESIDHFKHSIYFFNKSKSDYGIAMACVQLGAIYLKKGNYRSAAEMFMNSLEHSEKAKDKHGIAEAYSNLASMYNTQGDFDNAIEYYNKVLVIRRDLGEKRTIAISLFNLGTTYAMKKDYESAVKLLEESLFLKKELQDKRGEANILNSFGNIYKNKGEFDKAKEYFEKCLILREELGDKKGICSTLFGMANLYLALNRKENAVLYAERSLKISKELGFPSNIAVASGLLAKLYNEKAEYKKACDMQDLHKIMMDSVRSSENRKALLQSGFDYEFRKKHQADSIKAAKEKGIYASAKKQEESQRILSYAAIGLFVVLALFIYRRFNFTRLQSKIIEHQKNNVEWQKKELEEKQKELLDSIRYASRIQRAMLPGEKFMIRNFDKLKKTG